MAITEYAAQYQKENLKMVRFSLNKNSDAEMIEHLYKQENISGYIKKLIAADMHKGTEELPAATIPEADL